VRWVIKHNEDLHYISCAISFYSGKKRATHNGHVIVDLVDSREEFDFIVLVGFQRMIFTVDQDTEDAKVERKYMQNDGSFNKFKNLYSQPVKQAF
jgi:hypothetical protein